MEGLCLGPDLWRVWDLTCGGFCFSHVTSIFMCGCWIGLSRALGLGVTNIQVMVTYKFKSKPAHASVSVPKNFREL